MKISIAMCTYNGQKYLQQQLDSFVCQSLRPDELVICDDGSKDKTVEILAAFVNVSPFPVRIFTNPSNLGSTRNFVKAISLCEGDVIALSDQDDVWRPEKLSRLARILRDDPAVGGVFSDGELIDKNSHQTKCSLWNSVGFTKDKQSLLRHELSFEVLKKQNFITGATLMFRSDMRRYFSDIPPSWIHDAWMTWMLAIHSKIVGIAEPLIGYRIHDSNQVGVNRQTAGELLGNRTAQQMVGVIETECRQLNVLRQRISECSTEGSRRALQAIDGRVQYLTKRLAIISQPVFRRPALALVAWKQYAEFGKGWRSVAGDLAL